ncbi:MAG: preprotein translocase subunit YajC [Phycisphaerales bacterium]
MPGAPGANPASPTTPGLPSGTTGAPSNPNGGGSPGGFGGMIWIMLAVMVLFVVMTSTAGRKEKRRREAMLSALKRGDRVQTTGGIIGSIIELGDHEIVLRVDEASNTRIRFARAAVQQVVRESKDRANGELESKPAEPAKTR